MVMGSLTGRMDLEPILPVNHRHNVKLLMGTVTASECVNSPSNSKMFQNVLATRSNERMEDDSYSFLNTGKSKNEED